MPESFSIRDCSACAIRHRRLPGSCYSWLHCWHMRLDIRHCFFRVRQHCQLKEGQKPSSWWSSRLLLGRRLLDPRSDFLVSSQHYQKIQNAVHGWKWVRRRNASQCGNTMDPRRCDLCGLVRISNLHRRCYYHVYGMLQQFRRRRGGIRRRLCAEK